MGWPLKKLEDLCEVFADGDWIESKNQSKKGIRLIQTGNVGHGKFKDKINKARFISEKTFDQLKCLEIFAGDCLVSRLPDPVGRSCIVPQSNNRMITSVDCTILRFKKTQLLPKFFSYYTQSNIYLNCVESLTSGATRKRIARKNLGTINIPAPSTEEQKRIVTILDQAFAKIEKIYANTQQNLNNAQELFNSYLQKVFSQSSKGWHLVRLDELYEIARGGSPRPIRKFITNDPDGINWIKIGDATASGRYIYTTKEKIIPEGVKQSRLVNKGDFILSNSMSFGHPYIMGTLGCIHDGWLVLSAKDNSIEQDFLYYILGSPFVFKQFDSLASGSTVRNLNISLVSSVRIPTPSLKEQKQIVTILDKLTHYIEGLKKTYNSKLSTLEALKKSILQKAFTGKLTNNLVCELESNN
jgi:type I restriction enzyme, S subunit